MTFKIGMPVVQISPWREKDTAYSDVRFTECGVVYTIREILTVHGGSSCGPVNWDKHRAALQAQGDER